MPFCVPWKQASQMWQLVRVPWSDICTVPKLPKISFQGDKRTSEEWHGHVLLQAIQRLRKRNKNEHWDYTWQEDLAYQSNHYTTLHCKSLILVRQMSKQNTYAILPALLFFSKIILQSTNSLIHNEIQQFYLPSSITRMFHKGGSKCDARSMNDYFLALLLQLHCELKAKQLTWFDSQKCFNRPEEHHANHHDREDGDGVASHVHNKQVHWDLLEWAKSNVPRFLK